MTDRVIPIPKRLKPQNIIISSFIDIFVSTTVILMGDKSIIKKIRKPYSWSSKLITSTTISYTNNNTWTNMKHISNRRDIFSINKSPMTKNYKNLNQLLLLTSINFPFEISVW